MIGCSEDRIFPNVARMELPRSWSEAQELRKAGWPEGLPRLFFTGSPCRRGHVAPRMASDGNCTECKKLQDRADQKRPHRQAQINGYNRDYTKRPENIAQTRAYATAGRAARLRATPPWLTQEQKQEIREFYAEAQRLTETTGIAHEVDHIVPLVNKAVCGLHVPWNLQVMPTRANRSKSNRFDGGW